MKYFYLHVVIFYTLWATNFPNEGDTMAQVIRKANSWMERFEAQMGIWAEKIF